MPRRPRPQQTTRSEHWMRVAANEKVEPFNAKVSDTFGWNKNEQIEWLSPIASDEYAEYYDQAFLDRLRLSDLEVPLHEFWPKSGARWDGLARTESGKVILVEAKAYIEEAVDYRSQAGPASMERIRAALGDAKKAFRATEAASWEVPYYQYSNRLAHLHYLCAMNSIDAYLLFLYFADAPDVPAPCSEAEWKGAIRLVEKSLGLGKHPYRDRVGTLVWQVPEMLTTRGGA